MTNGQSRRLLFSEGVIFDSGALAIYQLQGETYQEVETSAIFPSLPIKDIPALLERYRGEGRRSLRRAIREWAIAHN